MGAEVNKDAEVAEVDDRVKDSDSECCVRTCCRFRKRVSRDNVPATRFAAELSGLLGVCDGDRIESMDSLLGMPRCGVHAAVRPVSIERKGVVMASFLGASDTGVTGSVGVRIGFKAWGVDGNAAACSSGKGCVGSSLPYKA